MPIGLGTNVNALIIQKNLNTVQKAMATNYQRLSSGLRINSAADDVGGSAMAETMNMQIRSLTVAERNANNALSMSTTAESGASNLNSILLRMREIAVQAQNGDLNTTDRSYLNTEFVQLRSEVDRIAQSTKFNSINLLAGASASYIMQVGTGTTASADQITLTFGAVTSTYLAISTNTVDGATNANANTAVTALDTALVTLNTNRSNYGAWVNRVSYAIAHIQGMRTNLSAALGNIRDADIADETAQLARNQVLAQAGAAVLAQANQDQQLALTLLSS